MNKTAKNISALFGNFDCVADLNACRVSNPLVEKGVMPAASVRPKNTQEIQQIIMIANQSGIGVVPVSSLGPHCKDGIVCQNSHIIVDLSGWKKIDTIDRRNRVCRIEPGVTYGELIAALAPHGLTVSIPLAPRSGKSVIAAVMDREPSTWPNKQWDVADPVASTEFIFGNGEFFRTGAAGGPGSLEKQRAVGGAQKSPIGPSQTDFHRVVQGAQGSMGIVTWITIRAEMKPSIEEPFIIGAEKIESLIPFVYEVQRPWLGEHSFILNRAAAATLMSEDAAAYKKIKKSLPAYICLQNIAGFERLAEERVAYQLQDIGEIARKSNLNVATSCGSIAALDLLRVATQPCGATDWRHSLTGHCLSVFFLTTLDRAPGLIAIFAEIAERRGYDDQRVGVYVQPTVQNHSCHVELMVPFDPRKPAEVAAMSKLENEAVDKLAGAGAFFSRPYGAAAQVAFKRNPLNYDVLKKIKNIFDPGKVLNPGKFGL